MAVFLWVLDPQALRVLSHARLSPRLSAKTLLHEAAPKHVAVSSRARASPGELVSDAGHGMGGTTETCLVRQLAREKHPKML